MKLYILLINVTYGGDGITTFGLPDLRGRIPIHQGTNPLTNTNWVQGTKYGVESVTLTTSQTPTHTHNLIANKTSATTNIPQNMCLALPANTVPLYTKSVVFNTTMSSSAITLSEGGNSPHTNIMPGIVVNFLIATNAIYPTRN